MRTLYIAIIMTLVVIFNSQFFRNRKTEVLVPTKSNQLPKKNKVEEVFNFNTFNLKIENFLKNYKWLNESLNKWEEK